MHTHKKLPYTLEFPVMDEAKEVDAHTGAITITGTITSVTFAWFFQALNPKP